MEEAKIKELESEQDLLDYDDDIDDDDIDDDDIDDDMIDDDDIDDDMIDDDENISEQIKELENGIKFYVKCINCSKIQNLKKIPMNAFESIFCNNDYLRLVCECGHKKFRVFVNG